MKPIDSDAEGCLKWIAGAVISLIAGGSGIVALLNYVNPHPPPNSEVSQKAITKEYLAGRWQVQRFGDIGSLHTVDYFADGTFKGYYMPSGGRSETLEGRWNITTLSHDMFVLEMIYFVGPPEFKKQPFVRKFKIIDRDHLQNIDDNYVADRVK